MEDIIEKFDEDFIPHEDLIYEMGIEAEKYRPKLNTKEFESHLDECNLNFKWDVMDKVFLLKFNDSIKINKEIENIETEKEQRVDALRAEMRVLEQEWYELKTQKERQVIELTNEFNARQRKTFLRKYFYEWADLHYANKRAKVYNEEWCKEFRNKNLLKIIIKYWKYFTFNQGNKAFEARMKEKVEDEIQNDLNDKRLVVEALESAIRELENQKDLEIKKKNIIKAQWDQVFLRGASSNSIQALKMSQNTLNTLYAGVKMPRYNGQNLLSQINLMKDNTLVVTKKVICGVYDRSQESKP